MNLAVNSIASIYNVNSCKQKDNAMNKDNKNISFEICVDNKIKQANGIECNNLKIDKNGGFLGYIDGEWKQLNKSSDDRPCGRNEILIKGGGKSPLVVIGVNAFLMNFCGRAMGKARQEPYAIQKNVDFSKLPNSLTLIPKRQVTLPDGTVLEWKTNRVIFKSKDDNINYARSLANAMDDFTRIANKQRLGLGRVIGISREKTKDVNKVLTAMGIDTSKDFYVNGKKFWYDNESGEFKFEIESAVNDKYTVRHENSHLTYNDKLIKMAYL